MLVKQVLVAPYLLQQSYNEWQPVAFTSCSLTSTDSEMNYAQIEKETLTICMDFDTWDQRLYGKHGVVVVH